MGKFISLQKKIQPMKKSITTLCCMLVAVYSIAQEYILHENIVKPSLNDNYITSVKKLRDVCAANKINMSWSTFVFEDNSYGHILPAKGTASLETDIWTELRTKIGQEEFQKLVAELQASMVSQIPGTIVAMPDHSYQKAADDEYYRMILYLYPLEGKETEIENFFLEWKKHYVEKKSPSAYNIYKVQYGEQKDRLYLISLSAKDAADMEARMGENRNLIGETLGYLWKKQMSFTKKYYFRRGYFAPDLGYSFRTVN